uniref:Uncharacterized protein n=1 Tax=Romanomermis culicivorax TaxID=13658 RepID=A0A915LA37_ROMCU
MEWDHLYQIAGMLTWLMGPGKKRSKLTYTIYRPYKDFAVRELLRTIFLSCCSYQNQIGETIG